MHILLSYCSLSINVSQDRALFVQSPTMLRADGLINTRPFGARLRSLEHLLELQVCEKRAVQDELGACQLLLKEVRVKVGKRGTC